MSQHYDTSFTPLQFRAGRPRWLQWLGRVVLRVSGWQVMGGLPEDQTRLVMAVAPHTSNWDFAVGFQVALAIDLRAYWLAKKSLFISGFRRLMYWAGGIAVDRSAPEGLIDDVATKVSQHEGVVIVITPEGTRSRVEKWKTGFLRIARELECPVMLVGFDYKRKIIDLGRQFFPSGDDQRDVAEIKDYFRQFTAKNPENF